MRAQVYKTLKNAYSCYVDQLQTEVIATPLGKLLKAGIVVGDYVEVQCSTSGDYEIHSVYPRCSEVFRVLPRVGKKKVTAANCDLLLITISVDAPKYKRGIVDRFLLRAIQWDIHPVVIFNKMDLYSKELFDLKFEQQRLANLGIECFEVCAVQKNYHPQYLSQGILELKKYIKNKTALFLGQSGVGKSALITTLSSGQVTLKSRNIGKVNKGTHTTTWSEIINCGEFLFIDSPGIRSFSLDDFHPDELINYFPDLFNIAAKCKFRDCLHYPDSIGCAFNLLPDGRERELIFSRLESYWKFFQECSENPHWEKKKYKPS